MQVHTVRIPLQPKGQTGHYAVDWQRDPPYPKVDEDRFARNREAVRSKFRRQ